MHQRRPLLLASTALAALIGGGVLDGPSRGAAAAVTAVPALEAGPAAAPAPSIPAAAPRALDPVESLSQKVDRLSRSDDPVHAFAAYRLATACLWARDHEGWMAQHILPADRALLPTPGQACGDIASDQIQSRLRWLERAALAGVHHAATQLLKEGPDGLGVSASADLAAPANAAWKQRVDAALEAGVRTCDPDSLETRVNGYENGLGVPQDRARALTYWVAYRACRQRFDDGAAAALVDADSMAGLVGTALPADAIARAVAEGRQIAGSARPLPGDQE